MLSTPAGTEQASILTSEPSVVLGEEQRVRQFVETPPKGEAARIVVLIQRCEDPRQVERLKGDLLVTLGPLLRAQVRRFVRARGTLSADDLAQVASIAALKQVVSFDASRRQTFEQWCHLRVRRELRDYVAMHAQQVRVSYDAVHGRAKKTADVASVVSRDASPQEDLAGSEDTPESLLDGVQQRALLRRMAHRLPPEVREVVLWRFGVGRNEKSVMQLVTEMGRSRTYVEGLIRKGLTMLRQMLEREQ